MVSPDMQYHLHMVRIHTHIHITRIWAPYTHTPPQIPRCGIPWMPGHLVVLRITRYGGYIHIRRISYSTGYGVHMHMMSYLLRGIQTQCADANTTRYGPTEHVQDVIPRSSIHYTRCHNTVYMNILCTSPYLHITASTTYLLRWWCRWYTTRCGTTWPEMV